jgi:SUZ domain
MRRNDQSVDRPSGASTTASSSAPSKAASEADGEDGNDDERTGSSSGATPAKERAAMTREEREAKYQEARERIFRDFTEPKPSDANNGDQSADMSRSSSASGRKKNYRQKTPHDDSFEVRSQFNAYYPGMPYTTGQAPLNMALPDGSFPAHNSYVMGPGASSSTVAYVPTSQNGVMFSSPLNMNPQYPMTIPPHMGQNNSWQGATIPPQSPFSAFAPINQPSPMMPQSSARSSPNMNNYAVPNSTQFQQAPSAWMAPPYQGNFQHSTQRGSPNIHWPSYPSPSMGPTPTPYSYGQLPNQPYTPAMQNSGGLLMPASYPRSSFNPQTRAFIPGSASPSRYPGKGYQPGPNSSYPTAQADSQQQWTGFQEVPGHATRVSSQASGRASNSMASPNFVPNRTVPCSTQDSIAKWGTPAHLPPKPPPSEVPSEFDIKSRNPPASASFPSMMPNQKNGPLVVSGALSLTKPN